MGNNHDRRLPRLEDVAARAKVSHQTVSRVINNHPNVSAATRERVEAAIAELGYRRNTAARSLVTRRTQTIGVLASELGQYGPANTLLGVQQAAREAGYFVSIAAIKGAGAKAISDAVRHLTDQGADGMIVIVPHDGTLQVLEDLNLDLPVIVVGGTGEGRLSGAMVDQKLGARLAVAHLISLGHQQIGHVSDVLGISLATSWWGVFIGLYAYALPLILYSAWVSIALWDLVRQDAVPNRTRVLWMLVVLVIPLAGPIAYYAFGRSPIQRSLRVMLVAGGFAIYVALTALAIGLGP